MEPGLQPWLCIFRRCNTIKPQPKPARVVNKKNIEAARKPYCEWCGLWRTAVYGLEVHHIEPKGSGGGDEPENLITLCVGPPNDCHGKAQRYEISKEELKKRKQQRTQVREEKSWEEYVQALIELGQHEEKARWLAGEIVLDMRNQFGRRGLAKAVASELGCSARYVQELAKVASVFPEDKRFPILSWQHHRVAARTKKPYEWLVQAADNNWSARQLEEAIRGASDLGNEEEKCTRAGERIIRAIKDLREKYGRLAEPVLEKIVAAIAGR